LIRRVGAEAADMLFDDIDPPVGDFDQVSRKLANRPSS
jgi:hypothetical protein